jgi:pimeloyl-ACP methyl ester carboxylesterase
LTGDDTRRFDMKVAPVLANEMYRAIPGAQFTGFEKRGHLPFTEEPDPFTSRIESFLGTIPAGTVH